jgi:hypothetical protein
MKTAKTEILLLLLLVLTFAGCTTERKGSHPAWLYVPTPGLYTLKGYPAEAALPRLIYTTNRIQIIVEGEVVSEGRVTVPVGCTVIQAVGYAGGFTPFAHAHHFRIRKKSGQGGYLILQCKRTWLFGHKRVWYLFEPYGQNMNHSRTFSTSDTDYELEDGDRIAVGRLRF